MIYKLTTLIPSDNCGVWLVQVFHTYTSLRNFAKSGEFGKVSVKQTRPYNKIRKKKKIKIFFLRQKQWVYKRDGSSHIFFSNSGALLKKKLQPRGKRVCGPISSNINRKKVINSFKFVLRCYIYMKV